MTIIKARYVLAVFVLVSALALVCVLAFLWLIGADPDPDVIRMFLAGVALDIAFGTFFVTSVCVALTILLGGRPDRRQSTEADLKVRQLELQIAELEQKLNKSQSSSQSN
jgi:hypothetical protein